MFSHSAKYYDVIYAAKGKDYDQETQRLLSLIHQHKRSPGNTLLDVACGTGGHLLHLQQTFQTEGLDLDPELLDLARQKAPTITYHQADMINFALGRQFDVIVCLFSAIGYVKTLDRLHMTIETMHRHTAPGGLIIVEPWLKPNDYSADKVHATFVDKPNLKIARMNVGEISDGNISVLNFHYLVATPEGVEHFTERHELGLFTHGEYLSAFERCGMETLYDEVGLEGRGLYIGINPFP